MKDIEKIMAMVARLKRRAETIESLVDANLDDIKKIFDIYEKKDDKK